MTEGDFTLVRIKRHLDGTIGGNYYVTHDGSYYDIVHIDHNNHVLVAEGYMMNIKGYEPSKQIFNMYFGNEWDLARSKYLGRTNFFDYIPEMYMSVEAYLRAESKPYDMKSFRLPRILENPIEYEDDYGESSNSDDDDYEIIKKGCDNYDNECDCSDCNDESEDEDNDD